MEAWKNYFNVMNEIIVQGHGQSGRKHHESRRVVRRRLLTGEV